MNHQEKVIGLPKGANNGNSDSYKPALTRQKKAEFTESRIAYRRQCSEDPSKPYNIRIPSVDHEDKQWPRLLTWFLGPKGENQDVFTNLVCDAITRHCDARKRYFTTDEETVTDELRNDPSFITSMETIRKEFEQSSKKLEQSVPFFSPRYQGHMLWDSAMPANLGYIQALLYNQNNVALEASPVTSEMELEVGEQLCDMLFKTCELPKGIEANPWGHLTSGGSVANIEALWASRNVKFVPLAIQKVLQKFPKYKKVLDFKVYLPRKEREMNLKDLDTWDLLNLTVDDIIRMPRQIAERLSTDQESRDRQEREIMKDIQKYSVMELGMHGIMAKFGLKKEPVVMTPSTNHYSWPKGANVLGLGMKNLKHIGLNKKARMDVKDLKKNLLACLEEKIPVISVVCVIGTTEESAVDPLTKILELREEMRKKGLNFAINADAAWGGYFMTMLKSSDTRMINKKADQYVPYCDIPGHTCDQLKVLNQADTITVDPHKSGFVPYSAGSLCYRMKEMKNFIKMEATVVAHEGEGDCAMGMCGIQGSKPGAAAAGVLMAHNTIGLDADGYGRILGQCMYGAKLFYCRWFTIANDDDPFVCVLMKDIPQDIDRGSSNKRISNHVDREYAVMIIRTMLFGNKTKNIDIFENSELRQIFRQLGPDMLINAFSVNIKGNSDVNLCNKLNLLIYQKLSHSSTSKTDIRRVPLILTQSEIDPKISKHVVESMKERLGLVRESPENLHFLINTVMNPFIGRPNLVKQLGEIFRQTVLTSIGTLTDAKSQHTFVCVTTVPSQTGSFFAEFVPSFEFIPHQYQAVVKLKTVDQQTGDGDVLVQEADVDDPLYFETIENSVLGEILQKEQMLDVDFKVCGTETTFVRKKIIIDDVPRFNHLDLSDVVEIPEYEYQYFLYGEGEDVYMTHIASRQHKFIQILQLNEKPEEITSELLFQGISVTLPRLPGRNRDRENGSLETEAFPVSFVGVNGVEKNLDVNFRRIVLYKDLK